MEQHPDFSNWNNPESEIYKIGLTRTQDIVDKATKSKKGCLVSSAKISGTKKDIKTILSSGIVQNLVNYLFKYETEKCDMCGTHKSNTTQLDRAHCNRPECDRPALLERAIDEHWVDEDTPIKIRDILIDFITYHNEFPLYILCKKCHGIYDKK